METAKTQSLPSDLRKHWEIAMAEKFPMTIQEAGAYIQSNYGDKCGVCVYDDYISVTKHVEHELREGEVPPPGVSVVTYELPGYYGRRYKYFVTDYISITDFRKNKIDEKLKDKTNEN